MLDLNPRSLIALVDEPDFHFGRVGAVLAPVGDPTETKGTWWDASFYDLHVVVDPADSSIRGHNAITYRVLKPATEMQS